MLAFIGDSHELHGELAAVVASLPRHLAAVIHVGDLKAWPDAELGPHETNKRWRRLAQPLYFIDGNHHWYPGTRGLAKPAEVMPGLTYVPRGTVLTLDGRRLAFLGGADSVLDRAFRRPGVDWWPDEERVSEGDVARFDGLGPGTVDILVTHTPPASVTTAMTGRPPHPSAERVEVVWERLGRPELIAGHMHESYCRHPVQVLPMLGVAYR